MGRGPELAATVGHHRGWEMGQRECEEDMGLELGRKRVAFQRAPHHRPIAAVAVKSHSCSKERLKLRLADANADVVAVSENLPGSQGAAV